jgi:hypothetical protein
MCRVSKRTLAHPTSHRSRDGWEWFLVPRLLPPTLGLALRSPLSPSSFVVPPSLLALPPAPCSPVVCPSPQSPMRAVARSGGCGWWWVVVVHLSPSPLPHLLLALLFPSHCSPLPPREQLLTAVVGGAGGSVLALVLVLVLVRLSLPSLPVPPQSSTHPASSSSQWWWGHSSPRSPLPAHHHIAPLSTP